MAFVCDIYCDFVTFPFGLGISVQVRLYASLPFFGGDSSVAIPIVWKLVTSAVGDAVVVH